MTRGIFCAAAAYTLWGLLPFYWKALAHVPSGEILAHRMVWALAVVLALLGAKRHWGWLRKAMSDRRVLATYAGSAVLLAANWFIYIWAVNAGQIVEASLGYFITPLVNVLLGVVWLKERLRPWQGGAIALATTGVLGLTLMYGAVPWIALAIAVTFGLYGLLRKTSSLNSLEGLTFETMLLFAPALGFLLFREASGSGAIGQAGLSTMLLLAGSGLVTAVPLLLFAAGARLLPLTVLGLLQYIAPTLQFGLGVLVYHEPFSLERLLGFSLIWLALALYTVEGLMHARKPVAGAGALVRTDAPNETASSSA